MGSEGLTRGLSTVWVVGLANSLISTHEAKHSPGMEPSQEPESDSD